MKMLVITREFPPYVLGGISYHLQHLYGEIRDLGHDVTILAGECGSATVSDIDTPDGIDVRWVPYADIRGHHVRFPIALSSVLDTIDTSSYDVAIAHTELPFSLDLPTIAKKHDCKPVSRRYMLSESALRFRLLDGLIDPTRRWVNRRSHACTDHLIYNSDLCRRAWNAHYSIDRPSDVIYNGVDTRTFSPRDPSAEAYLLFVGDSERKGITTVQEFAPSAPYPIRLVGPTRCEVPNTEALGRVGQNRLADLYSGAVATVHPARFEAFGNVVLESLACGTPVVTTDRCGAAELLDGSCGVVTNDLAEGIERAVGMDPQACRRVARAQSWTKVAERTMDVARAVVARSDAVIATRTHRSR